MNLAKFSPFFQIMQIPALSSDEGLVVVVSPLISLMHDQITALKSRGIHAISTIDKSAEQVAMGGECSLLYTTPESALGRYLLAQS